ncbi:MAG TPA: cytochrome d ubiquinol oxidase subunit II [Mycobacteriales bacterium]|nr:cytochrome d ubiquinol oxidase subunit II [Mycobacteriales bacterium]
MTLQLLPLVFVLVGLILYTVLAGADLGTGVWQLSAVRSETLRARIYSSIGPVWEANHVWLIFVLTVLWTAYPRVFAVVSTTLVVPLFLAAIGIVLRGTAYALHGASRGPADHREIDLVFGLSSVLTPFSLGAVVGGLASGRVPADGSGSAVSSWLNPTSILAGVLAVAVGAYLAAVQLAADSARIGDAGSAVAFRRRALGAGAAAGVLSIAGLLVVRSDAPGLYRGLTHGAGLAAVVVSVVAGIVAFGLVVRNRIEPARYVAGVAIAALIAGWAVAQRPDVLPGLTVAAAAAPRTTLVAVVISVLAGAAIVGPSLLLLFLLVLRGRMDRPRPALVPDVRPVRSRAGVTGAAAVALFVVGAGLMVFGPNPAVLGVGVVLLLAAALLGFTAAAPSGEPEPEGAGLGGAGPRRGG